MINGERIDGDRIKATRSAASVPRSGRYAE
jgi:hypothetical protein